MHLTYSFLRRYSDVRHEIYSISNKMLTVLMQQSWHTYQQIVLLRKEFGSNLMGHRPIRKRFCPHRVRLLWIDSESRLYFASWLQRAAAKYPAVKLHGDINASEKSSEMNVLATVVYEILPSMLCVAFSNACPCLLLNLFSANSRFILPFFPPHFAKLATKRSNFVNTTITGTVDIVSLDLG